ncbi:MULTISPECIES: thioesterase II family protein [Streptomyces]|uniref:Alpha/beta fold hydrolase n=1 Tax=Streptomyces caniscabiei TaxID=2746961 RepID=A0ABU4MV15_9ACTN|nr:MULTISPECIES: alpha/beta fold hydrolase [Streptomyces]MBE4737358.1 thioesterase [Streptomyces caniscabiei]MBE4756118.1 thioesterase [Streptomyces caniscabiei]MBE4769865.1 thioesterase [Streptomyces caniscabiei]MBE4787189.1 thioesterase [Streptomyces caniscabiei]MBE4795406.1 thioesterase [Streptomyces caniscabiei]
MTAPDTSRRLVCDTARPTARVRLVCFPHAGGSASFYRGWGDALPDVEVHAVQYPGRADRFDEEPPDDLVRLADDIADALEPLEDRPLAFFGHSLGAPIALETARALQRRGVHIEHLFASGSRDAPLPTGLVAEEDPDRLLDDLVRMGGTDAEMAADPIFREVVLPYLIADGRMFHDYVMRPEPLLTCPVTTIVGDRDEDADRRPWSALSTSAVREVGVAGHHFYLIADPPYPVLRKTLEAPRHDSR